MIEIPYYGGLPEKSDD